MAEALPSRAFGPLLRELRQAAGLTQAALAERAGLSVRAVQHLERSLGQPQRETARRLVSALRLVGEERARFEAAAAPAPRARSVSRPLPPAAPDEPLAAALSESSAPVVVAAPPVEQGGERKRVTVLVAQVAGLTDVGLGFDADVADQFLGSAMRSLVDVVHRFEGTVTSARGDGLTALFGAPRALEDHAVRACYAALAMHEAFDRRRDAAASQDEIAVGLRVGVDSGEVVLRIGSNDLGHEYRVLGPAVRIAGQLEQHAANDATAVSEVTWRLVEGYFAGRPLAPLAGDARSGQVGVFELAAAVPGRGRFERIVNVRQLTPFVGREHEIAALTRPVERARAGHGQVVALVGEPGVGKSRLLWEAIHAYLADGWLVLEAGGVSHGTATSYLPLIDLLKAYAGIDSRDDRLAVSLNLRHSVLALDPALESDLTPLLALLDAHDPDSAWDDLDPPERRRRTLDALKRLFLLESRRQPLALVFEDLHWIDAETQALLDSLVDSLPAARILLLVSYRPEYVHQWSSRSYYAQVRVDSLAPVSAHHLLSALLGDAPALAEVARRLIEATDGNPLFLEECVRALVEDGIVTGEPGAYRLAGSVEGIRVPSTVQSVLAARIDRLAPGAKQILQSAAVIGKDVPFSLLRAVVDVDEVDLRQQLVRLQSAELIYEASLFPELEYTFKHALTHDVAYGSLLLERRRALHARAMAGLETLYEDRLVESAERLAFHAMRGECWEQAVEYARLAGDKAAGRSAHREAAASYDHALDALRRLPESPERLRLAVDVRLEMRSSLYPLGEFERIVTRLHEAETIVEALGDQARLSLIAALLASLYFSTGRYEQAIEAARRTQTIGEATGELGDRFLGNHYLGLSHYSLGSYRTAIELLTWNVEALTGEHTYARFGLHGVATVFSLSPLVWSLAETGDFRTALARGAYQLQIAEQADHPYTLSAACIGNGLVRLRLGDLEGAIVIAERGVEVCRAWENRTMLWVISAQLGYAYVLSGRLEDGIRLLTEAIGLGDEMRAAMNHALAVGWLGEGLLLAGRTVEAAEQAARSLDLARHRGERGAEAWALRLQAEIAARADVDDGEGAEHLFRQALALAEPLGMRPLQAHCRLGLGRLLGRLGRGPEAIGELDAAMALFAEMGMERWRVDTEVERVRISM